MENKEKSFLITVHSEDMECIVTAKNEEDAVDKFYAGEIDEWLTDKYSQSDIIAKERLDSKYGNS